MAELGEGYTPEEGGSETTGGEVETGYVAPSGEGDSGYQGGSIDYASLIASIFTGINDSINLWYNISRQQADPCQAWINLGNWDTNIYRPNYVRAISKARILTVALENHLDNVIRTRGRSGGTGMPLERFVYQEMGGASGFAQELLLPESQLGPIRVHCVLRWEACEALILDAIRSHLPLADDIRNETIGNFEGDVLSDGIGLVSNRYSGWRIQEICRQWVQYQRANAAPAAHPNARNRLITLVGTWEGTGPFKLWKSPTNPEDLFTRVPVASGMFEAAHHMVPGSEVDLPPEDNICAGIGPMTSSIVWNPEGGDGDPILAGSKIYELVRFIIWTRNFRACMGALCFGTGGPNVIDLQPDTINIKIDQPPGTTTTDDLAQEEEGVNWLIVGAIAAAAWFLT